MVKCKDCCWYEKEHILLNDGTTREYTDQDVDALGIKNSVTIDVGINVGGRCKFFQYNDSCWMGENDFCSRGQEKPFDTNNAERLKEQSE